jgi:hypothetical protein
MPPGLFVDGDGATALASALPLLPPVLLVAPKGAATPACPVATEAARLTAVAAACCGCKSDRVRGDGFGLQADINEVMTPREGVACGDAPGTLPAAVCAPLCERVAVAVVPVGGAIFSGWDRFVVTDAADAGVYCGLYAGGMSVMTPLLRKTS